MLESVLNPPDQAPLPELTDVEALLGFPLAPHVRRTLEGSLLEPLRSFVNRPSKGFRTQLVDIGMTAAGCTPADAERWERSATLASRIVEAIHAGSLVVDDIEDGSLLRRGEPSLHLRYGLGVALNAANWLYFWPFQRIRSFALAPAVELEVYRLCQKALLLAHFGQAIDLGTQIDEVPEEELRALCLASLELKTGALAGLAAGLGALVAGADESVLTRTVAFGTSFGTALQMFDDLGNTLGKKGTDATKRFEDLKLKRPSWVWIAAREISSDSEYQAFREAVRLLPDTRPIESWLNEVRFGERAIQGPIAFLDRAASDYLAEVGENHRELVLAVGASVERLKHAYV